MNTISKHITEAKHSYAVKTAAIMLRKTEVENVIKTATGVKVNAEDAEDAADTLLQEFPDLVMSDDPDKDGMVEIILSTK